MNKHHYRKSLLNGINKLAAVCDTTIFIHDSEEVVEMEIIPSSRINGSPHLFDENAQEWRPYYIKDLEKVAKALMIAVYGNYYNFIVSTRTYEYLKRDAAHNVRVGIKLPHTRYKHYDLRINQVDMEGLVFNYVAFPLFNDVVVRRCALALFVKEFAA